MNHLHIDFETRSTVDLKKTGSYVYAEDETTDLWCACYAFGDGEIRTWVPGDPCPLDVEEHILTGGILVAHNANFERVIWKYILGPRYGWPEPEIKQWRCTMVMAYAQGIPGALADAAAALGIAEQKDASGHRLMMQMARPRKKTKTETIWWDTPEKITRLLEYCRQDVATERQIYGVIRPLKASELDLWHLDQKINDRGVHVDLDLCESAKEIVRETTEKLDGRMREATSLAVTACSNRNQIVAFLHACGVQCESIAKDQLEALLARRDLPEKARTVLEIRREASKASVAKIDTLMRGTNRDGRARGMLQFGGAWRTMRWAGRRFQPQNLKRPDLKDVNTAIAHIMEGDAELIDMLYGDPLSVVGDTIRGMISAPPGKKLISADYSNIEGRVLAWLAGEEWKCQAFRDFDAGIGADIYLLTASEITGIPLEKLSKDSPERQSHGKVPELALGFQGSVGAFQTMAVTYGVTLTDREVQTIVDNWRFKHTAIKAYWYDLEEAAVNATETAGATERAGSVIFRQAGSFLYMQLPSKRFLAYAYPAMNWKEVPWYDDQGLYTVEWDGEIEEAREKYGEAYAGFNAAGDLLLKRKARKLCVSYMGVNSYTRKWERCFAYGGLLAENATQATARDILAAAMPKLEAAGYSIILTVHDEIVAEVDEDFGSIEEMCRIMEELPPWAAGLPVAAAGWEGERYRK